MPPMTGRVVAGRYRLIEPIGRGAMGVVWRATDQLLDRDVAVKEVRLNEALGDAERSNAYRRTLREARTAARLSHRGVVTVYDVVEEKGRPWIIMELIRSESLDTILATDGPLPPRRAARIAQQLLSALAHAHAAGVLHRDVKPSNVLVQTGGFDERAVLTDFGIAQFEGDPRLTQTGMVMGSPGFTAPERIRGSDASPASDLWSLGATIYAACEGRGPYEQRGGAITTMTAIINEDAPVAPSAGRLGGVIAALLRREPARRPTAAAAANMIAEMLPTLPDTRRGQVQRTATVQAPSPSAKRSPSADGASGRESPAAPPAAAGRGKESALVPPPAPPLSSDVAPTGLDAPKPPAAPPVPAARVAPAVPAKALAATPGAPAAHDAPAPPQPATPAPAPQADEPEVTPVAVTSREARPDPDPVAEGDSAPPADIGASAQDDASPSDATVLETPVISPNGAAPAVAPASSAVAADPSAGEEAATSQLAPDAAGKDDVPVQVPRSASVTEQPAATAGSDQGEDTQESVTAPTVPVRSLAVTDAPAGDSVSAPTKPEKDAWWATAYQQDRSSSQRGPSRPEGGGAAGAKPAAAAYGAAYAPPAQPGPPAAYSQPAKSLPPASSAGMPPAPRPSASGSARQPPTGGNAGGKRGRRRLTAIIALAAAVIIAAVVAVTMMLGRHNGTGNAAPGSGVHTSPVSSTSALSSLPPVADSASVVQAFDSPGAAPSGWTTEKLTPAQTGSAAGFSIAVPPAWQVMPQQSSPMRFYFNAPDGVSSLEVDLTPHTKSNMLTEARFIKQTSLAQGQFHGYHQIELDAVNVRNTAGALWRFDWYNSNGTEIRVDDLLFVLPTKNGPQSYAIYMTAPEGNAWNQQILPIVEQMLHSFRVVTA